MNECKFLTGIIIACLLGIIISSINISVQKHNEINELKTQINSLNTQLNELRKVQNKKLQIKDSLITEINNYINHIAPDNNLSGELLLNACLEYNIDIIFVLAQGQLESGFGTKGVATKTNSVWNVMSYDGRSSNYIISKGHGYNDPNESITPYLKLLKNRYLTNGKTEKDLMNNFMSDSGHRYASSTQYEYHLKSIYNKILNQTNINELMVEYLQN